MDLHAIVTSINRKVEERRKKKTNVRCNFQRKKRNQSKGCINECGRKRKRKLEQSVKRKREKDV